MMGRATAPAQQRRGKHLPPYRRRPPPLRLLTTLRQPRCPGPQAPMNRRTDRRRLRSPPRPLPPPPLARQPAPATAPAPTATAAPAANGDADARMTPAVRRLLREHRLSAEQLGGPSRGGQT